MPTPEGPACPPRSARPPDCVHCGLPTPRARQDASAERWFCCDACELVWGVIHDQGLDRFYELRRPDELPHEQARVSGRRFEEFDDETFGGLYVSPQPDGTCSVELYLEGVHCAACLWLVERLPLVLDGVAESRLSIGNSLARIRWDPATVPLSEVARTLDRLGYPSHPYRGVAVRDLRRREDRALLTRIGVAGAAAGNVMLIAFALYGGMFHGMEGQYTTLFRWTSLGLTLPAVLYSAWPFFRGAWGALRARATHMDQPIAIGILAGFVHGTVNTIRGSGAIYFETVTALILFLLAGRYLQQKRQRAAADAAELLFSLAPTSARLLEAGEAREVALESLARGMTVEVLPGESVPVDGVVTAGASDLDVSLLTGESIPQRVGVEDPVHAGTVNLSSRIEVRVETAGESTRLARLMQMVEESVLRRAPVVRQADRIAGVFVAVVFALAAVTAALWWRVDPALAVEHSIALLIVTCPCALGLATPLAVSAAIGRAGRAGILIKGGDALERLSHPGRLYLDKTGTLTQGRTALVRWEGDERAKPWVRAVESQVAHPVARALTDAFADEGGDTSIAVEVERERGSSGVAGRVGERAIVIGTTGFLESRAVAVSEGDRARVEAMAEDGLTPVLVAVDGEVAAVAGLGDPMRDEAAETVTRLRDAGWTVGILSGDHPRVVAAVGRKLGLPESECHGAMQPEQKLAAIERAALEGPVVMVGDGVNDAAALSAATVGVAVRGGAEVAMAVADVFLTDDGLAPLTELLEGTCRTMKVIRHNLVFSLLYNVIGAGLAMAGWIDPLVAAVLMPLSSLTVITYSFRARTFRPKPVPATAVRASE